MKKQAQKSRLNVILMCVITLIVLFPSSAPAHARGDTYLAQTSFRKEPPGDGSSANHEQIEEHWDAFFKEEMSVFGVYGAVMVMVEGDEIVFTKGYGYADPLEQTPMNPDSSILRAGSIAKTVTATAILQLAEQGKLDLDADVNNYLVDFKIRETYPEPVTARQLINMTAGFDTRFLGIRARNAEELLPLSEYLAENMPPRVLPPGQYRRYNDHEIALAGHLVEVVSGTPYEEYVRQNIFEPLEMDSSTITLPGNQMKQVALGYPVGAGEDGAYPLSYYYLQDAPGAGFNTTAMDIGRYMIAHLNDGAYQRRDGELVALLNPASMAEMHQTAFRHHPELTGQANTFDEMFYEGNRYLRKQGGAPGMHNNMILMLEQGLGFYLFYNSEGTGLRNDWTERVLEMYLSQPGNPVSLRVNAPSVHPDNAEYEGTYLQVSDQTSETTIVKVQAMFDPDLWINVLNNQDGTINIAGERATHTGEYLFSNISSGKTAFELDDSGKAQFLFQARTPYERVSWFETPNAQLGILSISLLLFLLVILITMSALITRRRFDNWLPGIIATLNIIFLVGFGWIMAPVAFGGDIWQFSLPPSLELRIILSIPLISVALALILVGYLFVSWRKVHRDRISYALSALVLAGMTMFVYFLDTWNLLGWRF